MAACHWQWRVHCAFHYFYETRHWQWRVSLFLRNASLAVARLLLIYTKHASEMEALRGVWTKRVTASGALPFVYLKFYGSHSYF
jgi:hypothetical protein